MPDIVFALNLVQIFGEATHIDPLGNGKQHLPVQLVVQPWLDRQDQGQGTFRVDIEIQKEPRLFEHLQVQKMDLVNQDDWLDFLGLDHEQGLPK